MKLQNQRIHHIMTQYKTHLKKDKTPKKATKIRTSQAKILKPKDY